MGATLITKQLLRRHKQQNIAATLPQANLNSQWRYFFAVLGDDDYAYLIPGHLEEWRGEVSTIFRGNYQSAQSKCPPLEESPAVVEGGVDSTPF